MRLWYESIGDWILANPGKHIYECADAIGRPRSTVYAITSSDAFRSYMRERRERFTSEHDAAIIHKTAQIAEKCLDLQLEKLETVREKLPLSQLLETGNSALARLGYGPKAPNGNGVTVNVGPGAGGTTQVVQIERNVLEDARKNMRILEGKKIEELPAPSDRGNGRGEEVIEVEAEEVLVEASNAPSA